MVNQHILDDRKKDTPTLDDLTTIIWTHDMGRRLAIARMKMLKEQKELAQALSVTQSTISRIELGHLKITEGFTVSKLKTVLEKHFGFVVYGTNPERYNVGVITKTYWDTRLRANRKNKGAYSKSRIL